ncbi:hypothetical protein IGI04_029605, partial [Brassica rapa subsp. trilocularis]
YKPLVEWAKVIWFKKDIPNTQISDLTFLIEHMSHKGHINFLGLGSDYACLFCRSLQETGDILFYECSYSNSVWSSIPLGLINFSRNNNLKYLTLLAWQVTIYKVWRDRNNRLHTPQYIYISL